MDEFFKTRMGQRFFEATMPKIADEIARLNVNLEALIARLDRLQPGTEQPVSAAPPPASR